MKSKNQPDTICKAPLDSLSPFALDKNFIIDQVLGPSENWSRNDADWALNLYGYDTTPPSKEFQDALDQIRRNRQSRGENVDIIYAMSLAEKRSLFPESPENQNDDFKAGYEVGLAAADLPEPKSILDDPVTKEWKRRNEVDDQSFRQWKHGYSAGRFATANQIAQKNRTKPDSNKNKRNHRLFDCPDCQSEQHDNGLIAWCDNGHVYPLPETDSRYHPE